MKEVKITIPDNCELVKEGDAYVVKEKKNPPRSWDEFVKNYRIEKGEAFVDIEGVINVYTEGEVREDSDKIVCTSKEEAEAFLALMQLRQLRKAWVGDFVENPNNGYWVICYKVIDNSVSIGAFCKVRMSMSFPTEEMAEDFLSCFRDLCETAKILL